MAFSDGTSVSYAFDVDGNRTSRTSGQGATSYSYDALNRLTNESFPGGKANAYGYDAASNMTSFSDAGGLITYGYDPVNMVTSVTEPGSVQTTFGYDSDNNRTRMSYPNGVTTTNAYDSSDRLTSTSAKNSAGSTLKSSAYSYTSPVTGKDSALRWSVKDEANNTTKYGYDLLARMTSATTTNSAGSQTASYTYGYDGNGNATNFNGTSYAFNAANEVTHTGYGFDDPTATSPRVVGRRRLPTTRRIRRRLSPRRVGRHCRLPTRATTRASAPTPVRRATPTRSSAWAARRGRHAPTTPVITRARCLASAPLRAVTTTCSTGSARSSR